MATPTPASPNTTPPPAAPAGPKDLTIPAGKVLVLVDTTANAVTLYKVCTKATRVFTAWSINQYADEATAKADITAKGWKFTAPAAPAPATPAK
jgi:hypothetical protein